MTDFCPPLYHPEHHSFPKPLSEIVGLKCHKFTVTALSKAGRVKADYWVCNNRASWQKIVIGQIGLSLNPIKKVLAKTSVQHTEKEYL